MPLAGAGVGSGYLPIVSPASMVSPSSQFGYDYRNPFPPTSYHGGNHLQPTPQFSNQERGSGGYQQDAHYNNYRSEQQQQQNPIYSHPHDEKIQHNNHTRFAIGTSDRSGNPYSQDEKQNRSQEYAEALSKSIKESSSLLLELTK